MILYILSRFFFLIYLDLAREESRQPFNFPGFIGFLGNSYIGVETQIVSFLHAFPKVATLTVALSLTT